VTAEVWSARLGLPLDARLEALDPAGRTIAENDDARGIDPLLCFTAAVDGTHRVKIHDIRFLGSPAHVYRLTLTAGPRVERVYPLGARRAGRARFELSGVGLSVNAAEFDVPADAPAEYRHRITFAGQTTNDFALDVDDLPEHVEGRSGVGSVEGEPIRLPAVLNGRIDRPGDADVWEFAAVKGESRQFELRAARLGSPLDGVLVVTDAAGKELARAESPAPRVDPTLVFTPPAAGVYRVRVESRFRSRGGPEYAYRLRAGAPPAPDFRLRLPADGITVNRGAVAKLKVSVERAGGFAEPIALEFDGLPPGVTAAPASIPAKQSLIELQLKAEAGAPIAAVPVVLRGRARIGGVEVVRAAAGPATAGGAGVEGLLLAVGLPTPFKVKGDFDYRWAPRGTTTRRKFTIERNGYDGPIEVALADRQMRHLQGVSGPTVTVPAGATEFEYVIDLPPWMETGRTCRACVLATAVIKDADGRLHQVGFSSLQPNEQIVAVIEPGPLAIEIEPGSIMATAGAAATVAVRLRRSAAMIGPLRLEAVLPVGLRGVSADPVEIPAGKTEGTITLHFAADFRGPTAAPVLIRASAAGGPRAVAEARLALARPER
jgi:hypothetical protein